MTLPNNQMNIQIWRDISIPSEQELVSFETIEFHPNTNEMVKDVIGKIYCPMYNGPL